MTSPTYANKFGPCAILNGYLFRIVVWFEICVQRTLSSKCYKLYIELWRAWIDCITIDAGWTAVQPMGSMAGCGAGRGFGAWVGRLVPPLRGNADTASRVTATLLSPSACCRRSPEEGRQADLQKPHA